MGTNRTRAIAALIGLATIPTTILAATMPAEAATRTQAKPYLSATASNIGNEGPRNDAIPRVRISNYNANPTQGDHDVVLDAGKAAPVSDYSTMDTRPTDTGYTVALLLNRNPITVDGVTYGAGKVLVGAADNTAQPDGGWIRWQQSGITALEGLDPNDGGKAQYVLRAMKTQSTSADNFEEHFERTSGLTSLI